MTVQLLEMLHHVGSCCGLVYEISSVNCMAVCDNIGKEGFVS